MEGLEQKAWQQIRTALILGVELDEFDFRRLLKDYYQRLRAQWPDSNLPGFDPNVVLDQVMKSHEPLAQSGSAGARYEALKAFALRHYRLDMTLTGSDYGFFEKRHTPYAFDRAFYQLGVELVVSELKLDAPGYNPYRSTRKLPVELLRTHFEEVLEVLPDYIWWSMHDEREVLRAVLVPDKLEEIRQRVESAGFKSDSFGLYLSTFEMMHPLDD